MFWNPLKKHKILKIVEKRTKLNVQYYQQSSQSLESHKLRSISVSSFRPIIGLLDSLLYLAPSNPSYLRAPIFLSKSLSPGSQNSALTLCSLYGVSSSGSLYCSSSVGSIYGCSFPRNIFSPSHLWDLLFPSYLFILPCFRLFTLRI